MFIERLVTCKNTKALAFISPCDVSDVGVECKTCIVTKPFYCYKQNKSHKKGINFIKCTKCRNSLACPWSVMLSSMKSSSKKRKHKPPEHTIEDLKLLYATQNGMCYNSGWPLIANHGDGNPFNMSPERIDNDKPYTKNNVVLICQCHQYGGNGNYTREDCISLLGYNDTGSVVECNREMFNKPKTVRREQRKCVKTYDDTGEIVISKTCTDCGVDKCVLTCY